MLRVTSLANPRLRETARLMASSRDRRKAGKCVLEGEHIVAVYAERVGRIPLLVATEHAVSTPSGAGLAAHADATIVVPDALFTEATTLPAAIGVAAVVEAPRGAARLDPDLSLLLDDVQDPGNVGSMLRSAAAARCGQVLLSKRSAFAWAPKVLRAGQGAHFQVSIAEDVDLVGWIDAFRERDGRVCALVAAGGRDLYEASLRGRVAIVVGNEGAGISPDVLDRATERVTIPMPGAIESLNAAAAAAVCLFEAVRQRRAPT